MTNLYQIKTQKTFGGKSINQLLTDTEVVQTQSNDFLIRNNEVDFITSDAGMIILSIFGDTICQMSPGVRAVEKMEKLETEVKEKYEQHYIN